MLTHINIYILKSTNWWLKKKKKPMKWWTVHIEQTKKYGSFYTFTQQVLQHFHKIFIFLFWPIKNWHLNNCENILKFVVSIQLSTHINIYKKKKKQKIMTDRKEKKKNTVAIVATMSIEQTKLAL